MGDTSWDGRYRYRWKEHSRSIPQLQLTCRNIWLKLNFFTPAPNHSSESIISIIHCWRCLSFDWLQANDNSDWLYFRYVIPKDNTFYACRSDVILQGNNFEDSLFCESFSRNLFAEDWTRVEMCSVKTLFLRFKNNCFWCRSVVKSYCRKLLEWAKGRCFFFSFL